MIAISSPALSMMSLEEALQIVSREYQAWEIVGEGRHFLPDIEAGLKEQLPSYGLVCSVHAPLSDVNIGSLNPRMRAAALDEVLRSIASAGRLGFNPFTVHPGFFTPLGMVAKDNARKVTKESLKLIERTARENGVVVALENMPEMPMSMATTPKALLDLMDGTDMRICLDIGHANTSKNIDEYLRFKDRIVNVHIHDNDGKWDQHLPIGNGNIDFKRLMPKLSSYKGRYVIEVRKIEDGTISKARLETLLRPA
jgi:sugar phosphate isomerase/epimerase